MKRSWIKVKDVGAEPFRIFFPAAIAAAIAGVSLWPLYSLGIDKFYPGQCHARLMAYGFFGGFVVGFLGTALPRMLSSAPFTLVEVVALFCAYLGMCVSYLTARIVTGDVLLLVLLLLFFLSAGARFLKRADTPPPGFILVILGLVCAASGAVLGIAQNNSDDPRWPLMQHLLSYQGFVLFPVLGISPFLLPRFFGLPSQHDFDESRKTPPGWGAKAVIGLGAGALIIVSFFLEAAGKTRIGPALRFVTALVYVLIEVPFFRAAKRGNAFSLILKIAFILLLTGFAATTFWPAFRVGLLHLTLVGGFALVTLAVATRVIYGHSGNLALMNEPNRWALVVAGLICFALLTRISGDFWPKITMSHYAYGAVVWIAAAVLWAWKVLGKVIQRDTEE
jgi:uncharacterized protein involved in response to NO